MESETDEQKSESRFSKNSCLLYITQILILGYPIPPLRIHTTFVVVNVLSVKPPHLNNLSTQFIANQAREWQARGIWGGGGRWFSFIHYIRLGTAGLHGLRGLTRVDCVSWWKKFFRLLAFSDFICIAEHVSSLTSTMMFTYFFAIPDSSMHRLASPFWRDIAYRRMR